MNSRNRVLKTIFFNRPDHPPLRNQDISSATFEKYGKELRDLLDTYPPDMLSLAHSPLLLAANAILVDSIGNKTWKDEWGTAWQSVDDSMGQVIKPALPDWKDFDKFKVPLVIPDMFQIARSIRQQSHDKFCTGKLHFGIWDRIMFLRGDEAAMMDIASEPQKIEKLADIILQYNLDLLTQWTKPGPAQKIDGIYITDDFGLENAMMMSPVLWRQIFKPRYKILIKQAHEAGIAVQFHSCGNIWPIIGDLVEIGIDILGPLQSPPLSIQRLGREFAGKVTFLGLIDSRELLHHGTPSEIAEKVIECIETLGTNKGGYIAASSTTIMPQVPFENLRAYMQTSAEYKYK
ncbi:MAG: uroporphyrinogen decarboxylase family protein [Sedimentisphaerales bacterium]